MTARNWGLREKSGGFKEEVEAWGRGKKVLVIEILYRMLPF